MPLIGNKVIEKDLRDYLQQNGYYGRSAEFSRLELAALQRPGWVQVFAFEVRAKVQDGDWVELFGACRDDERSKEFDVALSQVESERDERLTEFSEGLITLRRGQKNSVHWGLIAFCVLALGLAGFAAARKFIFGRVITAEAMSDTAGWSQWGGPDRNFRLLPTPLSRDWNDSVLSPAWSIRFGKDNGFGGIVARDGVLFTMVREENVEVSLAVDAIRGRKLWEERDEVPYTNLVYGMGPFSTPLVHKQTVFFLGATGLLSARQVDDGKLLWQRKLADDFPGTRKTRGFATSPLIVDDKLVLLHGAPDAAVIALNPDDGSVVWARHSFDADYASAIAVDVAGERQLVCQMKAVLAGLDPESGDLLWQIECETRSSSKTISPVDIGNDCIIASTTNGVQRLKLSPTNAETVWKSNKIKAQIGNVLYVPEAGLLLGANGPRTGAPVAAVDVQTGDLLWRTRDLDCGFLWQTGNDVFCLSPDGKLMLALIDRKEATVITKGRPFKGAQIWSAPAMVGSALFVKDVEKLVALNLSPEPEP